ncbi:dihydrofolate reductase family protein [Chitinophaga sp. ARDCPP14]|uniref:dihydrofolate reductase family protein n=1 Tax=Chitinophaga sp. ARDCPP14 TaxID=3391139 RepID=UPI003F52213C
MRKIIVITFMSMDGVMQAPGAPEEDRSNGFRWGGWMTPYSDDFTNGIMNALMSQSFDLLLGRRTYEIFAAYWPFIQDHSIADKFNSIHKYAVSGKPMDLSWENSTLITGDVVAGLRQLKQQEGPDLLVHGSSKLVQTLLANGLVDTLTVWTLPLTIGEGKRLFREGTQPVDWKLMDVKSSPKGVIIASYEPGGEIKPGSFVGDNPSEAELARRKRVAEGG